MVGRFSKPQTGGTHNSEQALLFLPAGAKTSFWAGAARKLDLRGEGFSPAEYSPQVRHRSSCLCSERHFHARVWGKAFSPTVGPPSTRNGRENRSKAEAHTDSRSDQRQRVDGPRLTINHCFSGTYSEPALDSQGQPDAELRGAILPRISRSLRSVNQPDLGNIEGVADTRV